VTSQHLDAADFETQISLPTRAPLFRANHQASQRPLPTTSLIVAEKRLNHILRAACGSWRLCVSNFTQPEPQWIVFCKTDQYSVPTNVGCKRRCGPYVVAANTRSSHYCVLISLHHDRTKSSYSASYFALW